VPVGTFKPCTGDPRRRHVWLEPCCDPLEGDQCRFHSSRILAVTILCKRSRVTLSAAEPACDDRLEASIALSQCADPLPPDQKIVRLDRTIVIVAKELLVLTLPEQQPESRATLPANKLSRPGTTGRLPLPFFHCETSRAMRAEPRHGLCRNHLHLRRYRQPHAIVCSSEPQFE